MNHRAAIAHHEDEQQRRLEYLLDSVAGSIPERHDADLIAYLSGVFAAARGQGLSRDLCRKISDALEAREEQKLPTKDSDEERYKRQCELEAEARQGPMLYPGDQSGE